MNLESQPSYDNHLSELQQTEKDVTNFYDAHFVNKYEIRPVNLSLKYLQETQTTQRINQVSDDLRFDRPLNSLPSPTMKQTISDLSAISQKQADQNQCFSSK